jgi:hypothetical protein
MQEPIPNVKKYTLVAVEWKPVSSFTQSGSKISRNPGYTSTPSERVFSKAGEIVSRLRANLKLSTVDMLVFLSKNLSAVDPQQVTRTYYQQILMGNEFLFRSHSCNRSNLSVRHVEY